jgi:Bacterial regulatory proteins, luxR family
VDTTASLSLTRREVGVLALVAEGRTNRQIGQALSITPKTASIHVSRILAKLGVAVAGRRSPARRGGRDRPTGSASTAMIRVGRGRSSSAQQRMRLARPPPARQHHVGSRPRHPADLATRSSPGRVDVSPRSNALYDRYATEPRVREVSPMAGQRAGQRAMRLLNGSGSRRLLAEPRESTQSERPGGVSAGQRPDGGPGRS